jgi:hypothetical protein
MELKDFIERFAGKKLIINGETETYDVVCYFKDNFPEALENFVHRICEKQRKICADYYSDNIPYEHNENWMHNGILEAEQPKIDEL